MKPSADKFDRGRQCTLPIIQQKGQKSLPLNMASIQTCDCNHQQKWILHGYEPYKR